METEAIQIVNSNGENHFTFNEEALSKILNDPKIKDKPVCVVSIAGAFRQGKSFFLNFLLRYLALKQIYGEDVGNFLDSKYGRLKGFNWQPGDEAHTLGIVMWPEIFLAEDCTGQEIAIILLDTQGTFDQKSTYNNCATIFALSTLISSVQIYNLMHNIGQDHLNHLECFTEYGKWAQSDKTPFQKLLFLVRDWCWHTKKPFGFKGGKLLLDSKLDTSAKVASEIISQRRNIKELFTTTECFLMPKPGDTVSESTDFDGEFKDISKKFLEYVPEVVSSILKPQNLVIKQVSGENVTAGDLFLYMKFCMERLQREDKPTIKSIYLALVEANHMVAVEEAELKFNNYIEGAAKDSDRPYLDEMQLDITLQKAELEAMQHYQRKEKLGNNKKIDEDCKRVLQGKLQKIMDNFKEINAMKQAKEEERIKNFLSEAVQMYSKSTDGIAERCSKEDFLKNHREAKRTVTEFFTNETKSYPQSITQNFLAELKNKIRASHDNNNTTFEREEKIAQLELESILEKSVKKYREIMRRTDLDEDNLIERHKEAKGEATNFFQSETKNFGEIRDSFLAQMKERINDCFEEILQFHFKHIKQTEIKNLQVYTKLASDVATMVLVQALTGSI